MRRFVESRFGKGISLLLVHALIIPFLTFVSVAKSVAQIETLPQWAVVEFQNLSSKGGAGYGKTASEAVASELAKTNKYEMIPAETVTRAETELGYTGTLRPDQLIRLGQNIRATTIVSGQIVDYRVIEVGAGKQADVLLRVEVRDVASGLPINGAAIKASSAIKGGDVSDETLVNEAISAAAYESVQQIISRTLPRATVLNTLEKTALINRGTRSGFQKDQEVIVTRGRDQVATATVTEVEPDAAVISVVRSNRGIQPGDKVQVVFNVPELKGFTKKGEPDFGSKRDRARGKGSNISGLISVLLLVGIAAFLLGGNRDGGQDLVTDVTAEAMVLPDDTPAVKLSWRPDGFVKGNSQRFQWQIYRSDTFGAPVLIAPGFATEAIDDARARTFTWYDFGGIVGGAFCDNTAPANPTQATPTGVVPGTVYTYQVELIYSLSALDLPGTGTTGNTGGGTTGTTTTGGTTGLTTTGGGNTTGGLTGGRGAEVAMIDDEDIPYSTGGSEMSDEGEIYLQQNTGGGGDRCYFASTKVTARGQATPLVRPGLRSPVNNAIIATAPVFVFTSVRGATASVILRYVLQLSDDPIFPKNRTIMPAEAVVIDNSGLPGAQLSTKPIQEALTAFKGSQFVYWRIGVRNEGDSPGPVPVGGERYIFSAPFRFSRPTDPPIPPTQ
ncbi:MAG: penicillin-binding protein activator LpoB [Fimbriimonadaceae bacterium]|nr:penicillin-binding protein activator LpoB [Fimbriimonadaceae bacterium]